MERLEQNSAENILIAEEAATNRMNKQAQEKITQLNYFSPAK